VASYEVIELFGVWMEVRLDGLPGLKESLIDGDDPSCAASKIHAPL
jgi:hypothetical protein